MLRQMTPRDSPYGDMALLVRLGNRAEAITGGHLAASAQTPIRSVSLRSESGMGGWKDSLCQGAVSGTSATGPMLALVNSASVTRPAWNAARSAPVSRRCPEPVVIAGPITR